jgi:hypothetical protein
MMKYLLMAPLIKILNKNIISNMDSTNKLKPNLFQEDNSLQLFFIPSQKISKINLNICCNKILKLTLKLNSISLIIRKLLKISPSKNWYWFKKLHSNHHHHLHHRLNRYNYSNRQIVNRNAYFCYTLKVQ